MTTPKIHLSVGTDMEREGRFFNFPPDPDDLGPPAKKLGAAAEQVDAAAMKLGELRAYARKFPVNGSERSAEQVQRRLLALEGQYRQLYLQLHKLAEATLDVQDDITAAFHDPQGVSSTPNFVPVASTKIAADDPRWRA